MDDDTKLYGEIIKNGVLEIYVEGQEKPEY
jgi:hypothetical protein